MSKKTQQAIPLIAILSGLTQAQADKAFAGVRQHFGVHLFITPDPQTGRCTMYAGEDEADAKTRTAINYYIQGVCYGMRPAE